MDIDKLFKVSALYDLHYSKINPGVKVPKLPAGGNKRKLPDNPSPDMLKKMKFDTQSLPVPSGSAPGQSNGVAQTKGKSRAVTMEVVRDEDSAPDFAPGGDADYFVEEDDEGRFFGGGLTSEQKEILNIFENAEGEGEDIQDDVSVKINDEIRTKLRI